MLLSDFLTATVGMPGDREVQAKMAGRQTALVVSQEEFHIYFEASSTGMTTLADIRQLTGTDMSLVAEIPSEAVFFGYRVVDEKIVLG